MTKPINKVHWLKSEPWPLYIGVLFTQKAQDKLHKKLGLPLEDMSRNNSFARCNYYDREGHSSKIVMCFPLAVDRDPVSLIGVMAHEIIHAMQYIKHDIEEDDGFSDETEAYLMQSLLMQTVAAYAKATKGTKYEVKT